MATRQSPMTLRDLINALESVASQGHNYDRMVVVQHDSEGNGYSPLYGVKIGAYADGEFGFEYLTPEDVKNGYDEDDVLVGTPAIALVT